MAIHGRRPECTVIRRRFASGEFDLFDGNYNLKVGGRLSLLRLMTVPRTLGSGVASVAATLTLLLTFASPMALRLRSQCRRPSGVGIGEEKSDMEVLTSVARVGGAGATRGLRSLALRQRTGGHSAPQRRPRRRRAPRGVSVVRVRGEGAPALITSSGFTPNRLLRKNHFKIDNFGWTATRGRGQVGRRRAMDAPWTRRGRHGRGA